MTALLLVLTPIALVDATSITPICIVPLILLMSGRKPIVGTISFLLGIFVSYVLCMALVLLGLQSLIDAVAGRFVQMWNDPDTLDVWLGLAIGLALLGVGLRLALGKGSAKTRDAGERVGAGATPLQAFGGGFALTVLGLPGALPIFAAVDQILRADPDPVGMAIAVLYYCVVFIAPLASVLALRIALGDRAEPLLRRISDVVGLWGGRIMTFALIALGAVITADSIGWLLGHPLLPTFPDTPPS